MSQGLKLIRRMDGAGLIGWFPEDGKPEVSMDLDRGALVRHWTEKVQVTRGEYIGFADSPDDPVTIFLTKKQWDALC